MDTFKMAWACLMGLVFLPTAATAQSSVNSPAIIARALVRCVTQNACKIPTVKEQEEGEPPSFKVVLSDEELSISYYVTPQGLDIEYQRRNDPQGTFSSRVIDVDLDGTADFYVSEESYTLTKEGYVWVAKKGQGVDNVIQNLYSEALMYAVLHLLPGLKQPAPH